ncbi:polysaccharide pyruvyl transferase family protein [Streptacidiphilus sp. P02-A3a]|uniref:polysaccharide pyruvyl transferase family protein n=1 Tax=Streptacidiphilus sp. P02-A3a TaxID=2704468 RepID=UPI0015F86C34|nr:polysaccharide pyruvyl transferase family protein [Streptacidiphilus sp. P02-A3a]QMU70548.1 polysaccharide pyruvyl transferase family protein [Streptacidiphilus sp. P02-A3a]
MTSSEHPVHYLVCPAGIPNYGDELIAGTWLRHLAHVAPDVDVVVDCLYPETAAGHLGGLHPRARFTSVLWQLCLRHWSDRDPAVSCAWVESVVRDPRAAPGLADGIGVLRRARVVHLLGGGYLNAIWPAFAGLLAGITTAAESSGARTAMTGQGLWPPADGGGVTRSLIKRLDVVDVRDAPSAEFAGLAPSGDHCDDVFLGFGPHLLRTDEQLPEVMVSVQSLLAESEGAAEETVRFVAEVLRAWRVTDVGLLECSPDKDAEVLAAAGRLLPDARRYPMDEVLRHGLPARPGQCWISTRFHPHLVAAAAGAHGLALMVRADYYGPKHRSLIDGGSRWRLLQRLEIPERPASGGYRPERLTELRAAKLAVAERIYGPG